MIELKYTKEQEKEVINNIDELKYNAAINAAEKAFKQMVKAGGKGTPQYSNWLRRVRNIQNKSIGNDWKKSDIFWALEFKDKTDEEIFNSEMAEQIFFDECHKRNCYGCREIELALKKGEIPIPTIEAVLIYDVGLGAQDYPAILEGYKGKLRSEAQEKLEEQTEECKELMRQIQFIGEVGHIQQELQRQDINPPTANMSLDQKIKNVLKARGIGLEEAVKRFYEVGEI